MKTSTKKGSSRKGFSLVELLIAIVVLGIISAMLINSGIKSQQKARISAATVALDDFVSAFTTACTEHPGIMKDREEAWGDDGTGYGSNVALARAVQYINGNLDDQYVFVWSDEDKCYISRREDPWGGHYQLHEYPCEDKDATVVDPTLETDPSMRLSIWATGNDASIFSKTIGKNSVGVGVIYQAGGVDIKYNNVNGKAPFTDNVLLTNAAPGGAGS